MVTVRVVEPEDLPVLWAMAVLPHIGATADPSAPIPLPTSCSAPEQFPDLADPFSTILGVGGDFFVAEADGHLVGMAGFRPTSHPARVEVLHVRVHPALRRRGIGRELMAAVETGAASRGFKETWLDTATNMPVAMSFYEGLGYIEVSRETRPEWRWTLVYYVKQLRPAMDRTLAYTRSNRRSWNTIAPARPSQPPEFFRRGGSTLDDFEADLLPELSGKRMLHLACANGGDSISWALRGASVTGVDISDVAIESASTLARETAADARFVAADVYEMPAELRDFDVIYASWGVVCWLPDLDRWAQIIVDRLRSGGTFLLCEHHPMWEVLGVRPDGVEVTVDYFGRGQPTEQTYDQAKRPTGSTPETQFDAFVWPVSDVVMSLMRAGLQVEEFFEAPAPEMYEGLADAANRVPAIYVIKARKD